MNSMILEETGDRRRYRKYARDDNLTLTTVATAVIDRSIDLGSRVGARGEDGSRV